MCRMYQKTVYKLCIVMVLRKTYLQIMGIVLISIITIEVLHNIGGGHSCSGYTDTSYLI